MTFGEYVVSRWDTLSLAAVEHALVVALAIAIATAVGVGIGLLTYERPKARGASLTVSAGILTIPSLALLGLLIPITGLGWGSTPDRADPVRAAADRPEHRRRAARRRRRHWWTPGAGWACARSACCCG